MINRDMKNFLVGVLSLAIIFHHVNSLACPETCSCSSYSGSYNTGYRVNCNYKKLGYFPTNIPNNTIYIYLLHNDLIALDVPVCEFSPALEVLYIDSNKISELPVNFLKGCDNLRTLSLAYNQIYMIEEDALKNLPSLAALYLSGNQISEIPNYYFGDCHTLQRLSIGGKLTHIEEFAFYNMTSLTYLSLRYNNIKTVHIEAFGVLPSLTTLDLRSNQLSINGYEFLRFCKTLTTLDLRNTRVDENHGFVRKYDLENTPNLRTLTLSGNRLSTIDEELLQSVPELYSLNLQSNRLVSINESVCLLLPKLSNLYLSYNQINNISDNFFKECHQLKSLSLQDNKLTIIDEFTFANITTLRELQLYRNEISFIHPEAFAGLASLYSFSLQDNKLTIIDEFTFANITTLRTLQLYRNEISFIHPEAFAGLPSLYHLDLDDNPLSSYGYDFLLKCRGVKHLFLSYTRISEDHIFITKDHLQSMPILYQLELANNKMSDLNPELFQGMSNVRYLRLSNNKITIIRSETFTYMSRLQEIDLNGNPIQYIEKDGFGVLPSLRSLYMSASKLFCNCSVVPFWTWLTASDKAYLKTSAKCSNGTLVAKIPPQDLYHCNSSIPVVVADLFEEKILIPLPKYNTKPSLTPVFKCTFGDILNATSLFDIYWYINENLVATKENVSLENINSTFLRESDWKNTYTLNMEVKCAIRIRLSDDFLPGPLVYSRTFLAGMIPDELEYTVIEGQYVNITFTPTVPVFCSSSHPDFKSHCGQNFYLFQPHYDDNNTNICQNGFTKRKILFETKFCGLRLTVNNWKEKKILTVYGFNDGIYNYKDRTTYIRLGLSSSSPESKIWKDVNIPEIKVTIVDRDTLLVNRLCQIHNNPHIRTFDGRIYDYMEVGEYVMYRNDKGPYMVHALFTTCGAGSAGPTCNCGVSIRSRNSLFVFRTCQKISKSTIHQLQHPVIRKYSCDDDDMFIEEINNGYKIRLPHGTEVQFTRYRYSRFISGITIKPSVYDLDDSVGLCGVPNTIKDPSDDFTHRQNGPINDFKTFGNSWRITPDLTTEQLFVENPNFYIVGDGLLNEENSTIRHYCACEKEAGPHQNVAEFYTLHCNLTETTTNCDGKSETSDNFLNQYSTSTDTRFVRRRLSRNLSQNSLRCSADDDDDVVEFQSLTYDEDVFSNETGVSETFRNGWTYEKAYNICSESIQNALPADLYEGYVDLPGEYYLQSCIKDIELTADTTYIQDTIGAMTTFIMTEVVRNESLYEKNATDSSRTVLDSITSRLCPNNCSLNGDCISGVCECIDGYLGSDCSQKVSTPPADISLPFSGLCTLGNRTCQKTNIFGDFSSTTIWSKLRRFKILKNTVDYFDGETMSLAEYRSMFMVTVTLPFSRKKQSTSETVLAEGYEIRLSNDGTNFGDSVNLIIYNETCYSCDSLSTTCIDLGVCTVTTGSDDVDSSTDGQDAVEIIGSPNTISLLSMFVDQIEDRTTIPIPDAANNPVASSFTQDGEYGTSQVPPVSIPAASLKDVQIVDLQLTSEKCKTSNERKRKIKPEDLTRMQYEVLVEQKKKLVQQTAYYELMVKKLESELGT